MAKKKKETIVEPPVREELDHYWEYGQTNQERILEKTSRSKSARHRCKGPQCVDAFKDS